MLSIGAETNTPGGDKRLPCEDLGRKSTGGRNLKDASSVCVMRRKVDRGTGQIRCRIQRRLIRARLRQLGYPAHQVIIKFDC